MLSASSWSKSTTFEQKQAKSLGIGAGIAGYVGSKQHQTLSFDGSQPLRGNGKLTPEHFLAGDSPAQSPGYMTLVKWRRRS